MKVANAGSLLSGRQGALSAAIAIETRFGQILKIGRKAPFNKLIPWSKPNLSTPIPWTTDPWLRSKTKLALLARTYAALTSTQKNAWKTLASTIKLTNYKGSHKTMNAFSAFVHVNSCGQSQVKIGTNANVAHIPYIPFLSPPTVPDCDAKTIITLATITGVNKLTVHATVDTAAPTGYVWTAIMGLSRQQRYGLGPQSNPAVLFANSSGQTGTPTKIWNLQGLDGFLWPTLTHCKALVVFCQFMLNHSGVLQAYTHAAPDWKTVVVS